MTYPSLDPNSDKYPDRIFWGGSWKTEAQIERNRELARERRRRLLSTPEGREQSREYLRSYYARNAEYRERLLQKMADRWASDPGYRLKKSQYDTLRVSRKALERSIERAELHH